MENDCIFCGIIQNKIPAYKIYEDSNVLSFLDISQTTPGHTLLIPKKHVKDIYEYDEKLAGKIFSYIPKIARAIRNNDENVRGMNIVNNNGSLAGQSVFHSHVHIIPRFSEDHDGFQLKFTDNSKKITELELEKLQNSIKNIL